MNGRAKTHDAEVFRLGQQFHLDGFFSKTDLPFTQNIGLFRIDHKHIAIHQTLLDTEVHNGASHWHILIPRKQKLEERGPVEIDRRQQRFADLSTRHDQPETSVARTRKGAHRLATALYIGCATDQAQAAMGELDIGEQLG